MRPRCVGDVLEGSRRTQLRASLLLSFRFLYPWLSCLSFSGVLLRSSSGDWGSPQATPQLAPSLRILYLLWLLFLWLFPQLSLYRFFLFPLLRPCRSVPPSSRYTQTHLRWLPLGMDLSLAQSQVRRLSPVYWLLLQELPRALPARRPLLRALPLLRPLLLLPELLRALLARRPLQWAQEPQAPLLLRNLEFRLYHSNPCLEPLSLPCKTIYLQTWALRSAFSTWAKITDTQGMHWAHLAIHYGDIFLVVEPHPSEEWWSGLTIGGSPQL